MLGRAGVDPRERAMVGTRWSEAHGGNSCGSLRCGFAERRGGGGSYVCAVRVGDRSSGQLGAHGIVKMDVEVEGGDMGRGRER